MKKMLASAVVLLCMVGLAYADGYKETKKAGNYEVTLKMSNEPAAMTDNKATIDLRDAAGTVSGADIEVFYFMPSMPAMNYTSKAAASGNIYEAVIKPTMPGEWTADVKVKGTDGKTHKASFPFNAK